MTQTTLRLLARRAGVATLALAVLPLTQCTSPAPGDDELGMFDEAPPGDLDRASTEGKADGQGRDGPTVGNHSATEVWSVLNQWEDTDTAAANRAGLAWGEGSRLTWEEKYRLWVGSLPTIPSERGGTTFQIENPWGVTLPAPVLECAEVAYFLRAAFAAWYRLPFMAEARDAQGSIYIGHFGFIRRDGSRYGRSPRYARLPDHSAEHRHGEPVADWPSDGRLAGKGLYGGGDEMEFVAPGARAGAYFDHLFLNKRVGYMLLTLLSYFGSVHLADTTITFHLQPEAIRAGDVLVERWQRRGIGHTLPVMRATEVVPGRFEAIVASGSIPRRQPVWEEPATARRHFTNDYFGGHGETSDGEPYAALGGGLRRWRIPVHHNGRWRNQIPTASRSVWINSSDLESIAARVDRFGEILATVSPAEQRDVLLGVIASKREHLSRYPSSCSARISREEAFDDLYALMEAEFGQTSAQVDAAYRELSDYVFAELDYMSSRTCCWNSSTADMYRIVMDYNRELQATACTEPAVFMMRDGGYQVFADFAASRGEAALWRTWSADESCPQQTSVTTDTEAMHDWTPLCELGSVADPDPPPGGGCEDGDDSSGTANNLALDGSSTDARICASDADFYRVVVTDAGTLTVELTFLHADGDIDVELQGTDGVRIVAAASSNDDESLVQPVDPGSYFVRVFGYNGAENDYAIRASFLADPTGGGTSGDGNDTLDAASPIAAGTPVSAAIDATGDVDFYRFDAATVTATLSFSHATGDLDLELLDASGAQVDLSQGTSDTETVTGSGTAPLYLRVYGYSSATGAYSLEAR